MHLLATALPQLQKRHSLGIFLSVSCDSKSCLSAGPGTRSFLQGAGSLVSPQPYPLSAVPTLSRCACIQAVTGPPSYSTGHSELLEALNVSAATGSTGTQLALVPPCFVIRTVADQFFWSTASEQKCLGTWALSHLRMCRPTCQEKQGGRVWDSTIP